MPIPLRKKPLRPLSSIRALAGETSQPHEGTSHLFRARGIVSESVALRMLHDLKRGTASQAEKFFPTLKKTFEKTLQYLPKDLIEKAMQRKELGTIAELELSIFSDTIFLSPPVFNEVLERCGGTKSGQAFFYKGFNVIKVGNRRLGAFVLFPLLHEWIHSFDAASGITRSTRSKEALAYGINLYVASIFSGRGIRKAELENDETRSKEYEDGFYLGKTIASKAKEVANRKGEAAVQRFFHSLFAHPEIDGELVLKLRDAALR